eukprot:1662120-Rhodomonas_salina.1
MGAITTPPCSSTGPTSCRRALGCRRGLGGDRDGCARLVRPSSASARSAADVIFAEPWLTCSALRAANRLRLSLSLSLSSAEAGPGAGAHSG